MFWQHINEVTHSLLEVFKSVTPSTLFTFLGHLSLPLAIGIVAIAAYVLLEVYRRLKAYLAPVFAWLAPRLSPLRRFMPAISFGGKRHVALDLSHLKCGRIAFGRIIPENPDYHPARAKAQRCLAIDSKHICLILGVVAGDPDMVYVALVGSAPVDPHDELIVKGLLDPHFGPLTFNSVSAT